MKRYLLAVSLFLFCSSAISQPTANSMKYAGSGEEHFTHIIKLNNGNYVCGGYSTSDAMGNHGGSDFVIACISAQGEVIWKKMVGGSKEDGGNYSGNRECLSLTTDGGFFFAGATSSSDGDITTSKGGWDIFVARFDINGKITWENTYGGDKTEYLSGIATTSDGGCIFSATTYSGNNGDVPANHSVDTSDIWIVKLNARGTIEWSKTYGGSGTEMAISIKTTSDNSYIFTADVTSEDGDLSGSVPEGEVRNMDMWIVKIDNAGMINWNKRLGSDEHGAK
ncbi:hypothetical protein SAMN05518672_10226 [Chitinophaga sp. CF118]|uniref:hypothetical protein n=1 Tax=Chitinophaga sp. CF118 TaxID=1884367 RepID=UPI0008E25C8B|nr:hypothetical protein [Chitinophaga sp. CF118]SFD45748.1 hypothetical protein SAMN05518672_10226 [Chitinophaga sp. CF118]